LKVINFDQQGTSGVLLLRDIQFSCGHKLQQIRCKEYDIWMLEIFEWPTKYLLLAHRARKISKNSYITPTKIA